MAWDGSANAGFSTAEPWLPLHDDWAQRNVAVQETDPGSLVNLTRALLRLRRSEPALSVGSVRLIDAPKGVLAYERSEAGKRLLVILNLTSGDVSFDWRGTPLLSTLAGEPRPGTIRADEGMITA
jgi:oligo-1,6-glucosidase/alpha-glucosidase